MDVTLKREATRMMKLSSKRNWARYMLLGAVGTLKCMQGTWPGLNISPAIRALLEVQEDIDALWWDKREKLVEMLKKEGVDGSANVVQATVCSGEPAGGDGAGVDMLEPVVYRDAPCVGERTNWID